MFLDRFRQQIDNAEKRFNQRKEQREERLAELNKIDEGKLDDVDLNVLDDPRRVNRRISLFRAAGGALAPRAELAAPVADARTVILERIIKTNELMSAAFLIEGARVRRSVGRVVIRGASGGVMGFGTGSMISRRLMMTNNHVLESSQTAANSTFQFDFVERFDGLMMDTVEFSLLPDDFFITDDQLDFTLVAVASAGSNDQQLASRSWSPFISDSGKAVVGERVNIIQHPGGGPQQLALRQNRIIDLAGDFLHYETDTRRGSSGSPVSNDSWQTAALHHAGVPKRDNAGRILLISGDPWDGSRDTIGQIDWVANEGARISKIVEHLRLLEATLTPDQQRLLAGAFESPPATSESADSHPTCRRRGDSPRIDKHGRVTYTVPVEITLGIQGSQPSSGPPCSAPQASPRAKAAATTSVQISQADLKAAQDALRAHESETYYDEDADNVDIEQYYAGIAEDGNLVGQPLFAALHRLVKDTHTTVFSYKKARLEHLYPWVDLHPDRKLRSVYSGDTFDADEVIRQDLEVAAIQESMLARFMRTESASDPAALEAFLDDLEASSPFNCEHVVPQSWFAKKQPMKADLHHLFTCESDCNSFRGNIPYFEFPPVEEVVRPKCGRRETNARQFEPTAGKGPAARATLYFLIRYNGLVGDEERELQAERLPILLKWHADHEVTEYELHRNAAIRASQGNRNPLIDFPEWVEHIDFSTGFGA